MRRARGLLAAFAALVLAGCGQLDLTPEGSPGRVVTGRVELGDGAALPADATVTVRVVDATKAGMPPLVLGSQTLRAPGDAPADFRVEFMADDETLRLGLNIEARVSFGGRVRYFNRNRYALTPGNASDPHRITVNPIGP
jgi:uncharacterized lipoprotein YbaY